jgi:hypothetical protein
MKRSTEELVQKHTKLLRLVPRAQCWRGFIGIGLAVTEQASVVQAGPDLVLAPNQAVLWHTLVELPERHFSFPTCTQSSIRTALKNSGGLTLRTLSSNLLLVSLTNGAPSIGLSYGLMATTTQAYFPHMPLLSPPKTARRSSSLKPLKGKVISTKTAFIALKPQDRPITG